ncbi:MAG: hypothetical protein GY696_25085 [Gammaproteobacteria bacterium]|nr:hypothetical protein [Gammaproteobacteria bacterium]
MFCLKTKVNDLIEQVMEAEKDSYLSNDWADAFAYYQKDLAERYTEYSGNNVNPESFREFLTWSQDEVLIYVSAGFPYAAKNQFGIANVGEIEIELPGWLKRRSPDVINRHTDLYIGSGHSHGYGYITADYDFIAVDFDKVDYSDYLDFVE